MESKELSEINFKKINKQIKKVRRGAGVLSSVRRIGPELSKKVHKFFTTENCELLLVNE